MGRDSERTELRAEWMTASMTDDRCRVPVPEPAPEYPNLIPDGRDLGPERVFIT
jgi:hypothetical protein